ncbi:MAG: 1-acyl-sn-glycerol-3-phosphate acyltransferase [Proteobacteria bacterium]|jgi:1-acyl-sn-glycerol-3-phosphate acyltransferase|nr:1-acyl-sn-glycerol-3-phosphate acyltransferase [Pseudomonadota bacterium]
MQFVASLIYTTFFLFFTFGYGVLFCIVAPVLPFRARFMLARIWAGTLLLALKVICRLDYRVEGAENLPAEASIALVKHSSSWETFAQAWLLPPQAWVLKRELTWIPFVGWGIRLLRGIAIDRGAGGAAVRQMIEQGRDRLAAGIWIVVFPEGTRMAPGETRRYGVGGAAVATETGALVVPVAHNAGYFWPRRGLMKKPGTIRVVIGKPIVTRGRDPREINEEAQRFIEANSGPP